MYNAMVLRSDRTGRARPACCLCRMCHRRESQHRQRGTRVDCDSRRLVHGLAEGSQAEGLCAGDKDKDVVEGPARVEEPRTMA